MQLSAVSRSDSGRGTKRSHPSGAAVVDRSPMGMLQSGRPLMSTLVQPLPTARHGVVLDPSRGVSQGDWEDVCGTATTAALDSDVVAHLLEDPAFRPGPRPSSFSRGMSTWVFKEGRDFHVKGKAAAGRHSDRWCAPSARFPR